MDYPIHIKGALKPWNRLGIRVCTPSKRTVPPAHRRVVRFDMIRMDIRVVQLLICFGMFFERRLIFLSLGAALMLLITLEVFAYLFFTWSFTPFGSVFGGRPGLPVRNFSAQNAKRVLP